ncbi:MAG: manganese transporter [Verrucomicrobiales bacterium]|nr:manganese transporter [Verrucomicrobiales bacterium]
MQRNLLNLFVFAGLSLFLVSCSPEKSAAPDPSPTDQGAKSAASIEYPYKIVTTCGMVTDIVKQVAGKHGDVEGLMGEGVDPHLYRPTRDDIQKLSQAQMIFYSGLMLEGRMGDSFAKLARQGIPAYPVTELLQQDYLMEPEEFEGHWDPHVWNDVSAWISAVNAVAKALGEFDKANAESYAKNAAAYTEQLTALDEYAKKSIATIPEKSRVLITAHDAFGYFSRAYGIKVMAAQGVTTVSEAAISDINNIVDFVVKNKVGAIFVENIVSDRNLKAILEGAKAKGHSVEIGGTLFSDAMGAPGTYEGTYVGMVDHNVTLITRKLGGEAPEKGLNGKLSLEE